MKSTHSTLLSRASSTSCPMRLSPMLGLTAVPTAHTSPGCNASCTGCRAAGGGAGAGVAPAPLVLALLLPCCCCCCCCCCCEAVASIRW